jgi:hypothetical protein
MFRLYLRKSNYINQKRTFFLHIGQCGFLTNQVSIQFL